MKTIKLLLVAFTALLATSCSDDDGPGFQLTAENLSGSYDVTFYNVVETEIVNVSGTDVTSEVTVVGDTFTNAIYTFNANGTYSLTGGFRANETSRVNGTVVDTDSYVQNFDDSGSYTVDTTTRTITLNPGVDAEVINVSSFTANSATLKQTEVDGGDRFEAEIRITRR